MAGKSHHQHKIEELDTANKLLSSVKKNEKEKVTIRLNDRQNTVLFVSPSKLKQKIDMLKKDGKKIKQIL